MKKRLIKLLQLFSILALIFTSTVFATVDAKINVDRSSVTTEAKKTFTVTLSAEGVNEKINNVEGYIDYDSSVLETLTVDSIVTNSDGKVKIGDEELPVIDFTNATIDSITDANAYVGFNGKPRVTTTSNGNTNTRIVIDFANGINKNEDLITITFKVKDGVTKAQLDSAKAINFTFDMTTATEKSDQVVKSVTLAGTVPQDEPDANNTANNTANNAVNNAANNTTNNTVNNTANKITNNTTNNTANNTAKNNTVNNAAKNNTNTTNRVDNTVSGNTLPSTGAKMIIIPAVILIFAAYISYNRYMKIKNV